MAIAYDNASNATDGTVQSVSWNHTCTGSNLILIVGVSAFDITLADRTVDSVTYNGVSLTWIRSDDNSTATKRSELWYIINPATGSHQIVVTFATSPATVTNAVCGAISLTGVDQTNPIDANNGANGQVNIGEGNQPSISVTTVADNCWVVDNLAFETSPTVGANQTQRYNTFTGSIYGAGSTEGPKTPAGSVTMNWSGGSFLDDWAISAASFAPSAESTVKNLAALGVG